MRPEIYVSTDVEADGPIPGPHSMLSFASAAFGADKKLLGTFERNLQTLPGASADPRTAAWWQTQPEAWAACRKDPREPAQAMADRAVDNALRDMDRRQGYRGPVSHVDDEAAQLELRTRMQARYGADPLHVKEAANLLVNAKRPVIYAGQGVHYAKAWPQLKRLAERLAIPVTTSLGGKSSFPETHPLSLGSGGLAVPRAVPKFLGEADVIFGIFEARTAQIRAVLGGNELVERCLHSRDHAR